MFDGEAVKPGARAAARFAYAAGCTGILANLYVPVWFVFVGRYLGASVG